MAIITVFSTAGFAFGGTVVNFLLLLVDLVDFRAMVFSPLGDNWNIGRTAVIEPTGGLSGEKNPANPRRKDGLDCKSRMAVALRHLRASEFRVRMAKRTPSPGKPTALPWVWFVMMDRRPTTVPWAF
jgi:hypothetical protein